MGIDLNGEVAKAGEIMARYRVSEDDQVAVIRILLDAGVEHCLQEQARIRANNDSVITRALGGLVH